MEQVQNRGCVLEATKEFSKTAAKNKENNNTITTTNATTTATTTTTTNTLTIDINRRQISQKRTNSSQPNRVLNRDIVYCTARRNGYKIPISNKNNIHVEKFTFILYIMTLAVLIQQISAAAIYQPAKHIDRRRVDAEDDLHVPVLPIKDFDSDNVSSEINARIHKRHLDYVNEMNSEELEWVNPCGGTWDETLPTHRSPVKRILSKLQNDINIERKTLRAAANVINTTEIRTYSKHKGAYRFLPVLKLNSNVALRRWHRQIQLYVGAFAYLGRAQLKQSARSILCEIESAINNTSGARVKKTRLNFLTRDAMEKRLKFQTNLTQLYSESPHQRHHHHHHSATTAKLSAINPIDLIFTKYRYFNYLRSMTRIIRTHIRRPGRVTLDSRSASSASSSAQASSASALADSLMNSSALSELSHPASNSVELVAQRSGNASRNISSSNSSRRNNRKNGTRKTKQQQQQRRQKSSA